MKTITTAVVWACFGTYGALTFAWAVAQEPALPASPPVSVESRFQAAGRHGDEWLGPGDHTRTVTAGPATRRARRLTSCAQACITPGSPGPMVSR